MSDLLGWVDWALTGLFVVVGVIMVFFILLQEGKGGGLASLGGTKAAGVEGVTNPIRRATVYMAVLFFLLAIILGRLHKPETSAVAGALKSAAEATAPAEGATTEPGKAAPEQPATEAGLKTVETKPAEAPKTEAKKVEEKKAEETKAETRKAEEKKVEDRKTDEKKTEEKKAGAAAP
ncbi:MAG: preprotein translocase subunit SecG [Planctomycetota bacterium]|nr:preprotein translocase subunit SecG [Planctomycetota bacterium]